jgi:hypothetical protein
MPAHTLSLIFKQHVKRSLLIICSSLISLSAYSGSTEQAKQLHDRITGVPADDATISNLAALIDAGSAKEAALQAIERNGFYNVTLKNWVTPWTNEAQDVFAPLNDYTATVIGLIRDQRDFREVLTGNYLYVGNVEGLPAYSTSANTHYENLESSGAALKDVLVQQPQSTLLGIPDEASAGVMTSRAGAKAFFSAGTNRAMFRFTLMNHMCRDLELVKDTSISPDRVRQDVTRSPGGDSRIFLNRCVGCHSGMDPMAQAFAYYEYEYDMDNDPEGDNGRLVYNAEGQLDPETGTRVQKKYHINATNFPFGYVTPDDKWDNYWRQGDNRSLGWSADLPGSGQGAKSLGAEFANSEAFAGCQVEKVFKAMCLRPPTDAADRNQIATMTATFKTDYDIKQVFAESAVYCMGE